MKTHDNLGDEYEVTSLDDADPELDQNGLGTDALLTSEDADLSDDTDDDAAFEGLREDLSPGEASDVVNTMRPLSREENEILDSYPFEGLSRVDDAEHQDDIIDHSRQGYTAMDNILDDAVYGDPMDNEEKMERMGRDSDVGFGLGTLKRAARRAGRVARRAATSPLSVARKVATSPLSAAKRLGKMAMRFVPGRDRGKAKVVRDLYGKLVREHANFLALQDKQAGRVLQPMSSYVETSKPWAKQQIARGGLPTSTIVSGADVLGADVLGSDVMGSWWNPLSWFFGKSQTIIKETAPERSEMGPDGSPVDPSAYDQSYQSFAEAPPEAYPAESYPADTYPPEAYPDSYEQGDLECGIGGEDSLVAFATEILSGRAPRRSGPTKEDELVEVAVVKLRAGRPLSAGELAVLATLAKGGHARAQKVYGVLMRQGAAVSGSDSGAWVHKLNPSYWFKSSDEKRFKDREVEEWKRNANLQEQLQKRQQVLSQAERAKKAAEAVAQAQAQAAATEAQLKAIADSLAGELTPRADQAGALESLMGHEKPTPIASVVKSSLAKAGLSKRASSLYDKISRGQKLEPDEIKDVQKIARVLHQAKVVHGDLYEQVPVELSVLHGAFVGADLTHRVKKAQARSATCRKVATALAAKVAAGQPLTTEQVKIARALDQSNAKLAGVVHSFAARGAFRGLDKEKSLRASVVLGAAKAAMTPAEQKMLVAIRKLAAAGNPRAQRSLKMLQDSGQIVGGDQIGFSFSEAFKYATAPIVLPAKALGKGLKWTGQKMGIVKKGRPSPDQVRLDKMRAAAKRRAAATARARAADAQTEAELRAQQSIASAAEAEADAADAEALAKEAAMRTSEKEADPEQATADDADSSGSFVGGWTSYVGAASKKVVAKASEKSPTGTRIRAGAALYERARRGDKQAIKAIAVMKAKSKRGDAQAKTDLAAVKVGRKAIVAKERAQRREVRKLRAVARKKKVIAVQRRFEARAANKLARAERKRELRKLSKIERRSASGDRRARAYVASQAELAKKGDRGAKVRLEKMKLARKVRLSAPSKRERRNLAKAGRLYSRARKGDVRAARQIRVIETAAKAGDPNAKRAFKRLKVAAAVEAAVATGAIAAVVSTRSKKSKKSKRENRDTVKRVRAKMLAGTASREELAAGYRAAYELGDKKSASQMAMAASNAPAASETIRSAAAVVAAKESGNASAKKAITSDLEAAKAGDPEAVRRTGNVVAANTIDDIKQGRPVSPAMRDAVNLQARAAEGDQSARDEINRITTAATEPNPSTEATAAAVTLAAAAVTAKALASKPKAREQYLQKVNELPDTEKPAAEAELSSLQKKANDGSITAEEGQRASQIALRLGRPKVAVDIASKAPPVDYDAPLSSLPDQPQRPITGAVSLIAESLKAITFSTRDPLANYREGLAARGTKTTPDTTSGWSPFDYFRRNPLVAPGAALAASATSFLSSLANKSKSSPKASTPPQGKKPAPSASPEAAAPATPAPAPKASSDEPTSASGEDKSFKDYVSEALRFKTMSKRDFELAVELQAGRNATPQTKQAVAKKVLDFLAAKEVKVGT